MSFRASQLSKLMSGKRCGKVEMWICSVCLLRCVEVPKTKRRVTMSFTGDQYVPYPAEIQWVKPVVVLIHQLHRSTKVSFCCSLSQSELVLKLDNERMGRVGGRYGFLALKASIEDVFCCDSDIRRQLESLALTPFPVVFVWKVGPLYTKIYRLCK